LVKKKQEKVDKKPRRVVEFKATKKDPTKIKVDFHRKKPEQPVEVKPPKMSKEDLRITKIVYAVFQEVAVDIDKRFESLEQQLNYLNTNIQKIPSTSKGNPGGGIESLLSNPKMIKTIMDVVGKLFEGETKKEDDAFTVLAKASFTRRMKILEDKDAVDLEILGIKRDAMKLDLGLTI